ncbi:MAG TPA: hypothetical protein PLX23_00855 [Candidatus Hydrogenedens sp.]|nr:hypothetical protein [Candidatus Hydrogenedens sp.]
MFKNSNYNISVKRIFVITFLCSSTFFLFTITIACKTATEKKGKEKKVTEIELIPFVPDNSVSTIRYIKGTYPNIFSPESQATWVITDSTSPSRQLSIDIVLVSSFQDASIAYDCVRLRGFNVYMILNENTEIYPIQIIINKPLEDTPSVVPQRFKKRVTLTFPCSVQEILIPKERIKDTQIILILNGFDTTFCFSWSPKQLPMEVPLSMELKNSHKIFEKTKTLTQKVLNWTHIFD